MFHLDAEIPKEKTTPSKKGTFTAQLYNTH